MGTNPQEVIDYDAELMESYINRDRGRDGLAAAEIGQILVGTVVAGAGIAITYFGARNAVRGIREQIARSS